MHGPHHDPDGGAGGASSSDPSNEHPNSHDFQQIDAIYSHLDYGSTIGAATPVGEPVRVERKSRITDSTTVEHFANGTKRVTHVFWAGTPRDHAHVHDLDHDHDHSSRASGGRAPERVPPLLRPVAARRRR